MRGLPFDSPAGYGWADTEGHVSRAEQLVVDAAHHLVDLALAAGDPHQALWATTRGRRAYPASDLLNDDLRRARTAAQHHPSDPASLLDTAPVDGLPGATPA